MHIPAICHADERLRRLDSAFAIPGRVARFETFGDEQVWTDKLHLNEVVEKNVDPTTALKVGLKVDADALPAGILEKVDLKSPATTVALLKMNAIVGLQATVDANNHITRLGVTLRAVSLHRGQLSHVATRVSLAWRHMGHQFSEHGSFRTIRRPHAERQRGPVRHRQCLGGVLSYYISVGRVAPSPTID